MENSISTSLFDILYSVFSILNIEHRTPNSEYRRKILQISGPLFFGLFIRCSAPQPTEAPLPTATQSTDTIGVQYARGFSVSYEQAYPVLRIHSSADTTRYLLLPRDVPQPDAPPVDFVIRTPVERLVVTSTTHLGMVALLNIRDRLVGIGRTSHVYDSAVRARAAQGFVQEIGTEGNVNTELVLSLQPDLVLVSAMPNEGLSPYQSLLNAGIPVIAIAEWQEAHPLGKAEWVKLLAVLTQQEDVAERRFGDIASAYDSIADRAQQAATPPAVITGSPFQGAWYVPGRNSYVGQLLRDAHATWPGEDNTSAVSLPMSLETVYPFGLRADFWVNVGLQKDLNSLGEQDERLTDFRPFQQQTVYNYFRRTSELGGSDYYESGTVRPDRVLADLVEIFHPDVLDHSLYYYQKLE